MCDTYEVGEPQSQSLASMITWMHDGHHEVSEPERASAPEWHSNVGADEVAEIRLRSRPVIGACSGRAKLYHLDIYVAIGNYTTSALRHLYHWHATKSSLLPRQLLIYRFDLPCNQSFGVHARCHLVGGLGRRVAVAAAGERKQVGRGGDHEKKELQSNYGSYCPIVRKNNGCPCFKPLLGQHLKRNTLFMSVI